jgi:D-alanyl-D-alanine carboxypeptidase
VIEAITGRSLEDALQDRIFVPLGMTSAGLMMTGDPFPTNMALGASGSLGVVTRYHPSVGWAAGSAYMTSADLAHFVSAMLSGELYDSALVSEQRRTSDWTGNDAEGVDSSYGLGVIAFDVQGRRLEGHLGGVDGFTSAALRDSESGMTTIVLSNQNDMMRTVLLALEAMEIDLGM